MHKDITRGVYWNALGVFRVEESKTNPGRLYAKKLDPATKKWSFEKGAIHNLQPQTRVSLELAKAYGLKTGRCLMCGRELTAPESVAQGIGPICAGGF